MRDCDTVEFFPHDFPFPRVTLKDHLKQAATDIISILSNPPSSAIPSFQARDSTNQAITEIAKLLKRIDKIPNLNLPKDASAPRVVHTPMHKSPSPHNIQKHIIPYSDNEVEGIKPITETDVIIASTLQTHSNSPKNIRYNNLGTHRYNLCSNISTPTHIVNYRMMQT